MNFYLHKIYQRKKANAEILTSAHYSRFNNFYHMRTFSPKLNQEINKYMATRAYTTNIIYESVLDDVTTDDMSINSSRQLARDVVEMRHQSDSYFNTDVYIQVDYYRLFEYPPLLAQIKDALTYQLQQFTEFTFSSVRIVTTNEIYHQNDKGISELSEDKARLYGGNYYFIFAYKYERNDAAPGFRKLIKIFNALLRYIFKRQSYGLTFTLYPRENCPKLIKDPVELRAGELSEIYAAMISKDKRGSVAFYKYFWKSYEIMETLVEDETTYPSLIRVFHGFDNMKDTMRSVINQQVEDGDYQGGPRMLVPCKKLKKDLIGKNVDFDYLTRQTSWYNWVIYWTSVDHSEQNLKGKFYTRQAANELETSRITNFNEFKKAFEDGRFCIKDAQVYEYDNKRRFSVIMYLGWTQSKFKFTVEAVLSFCAHKSDYKEFCEQIEQIIPGIRPDSLEEVEINFSKPADIY